jgi:hypothetical protein
MRPEKTKRTSLYETQAGSKPGTYSYRWVVGYGAFSMEPLTYRVVRQGSFELHGGDSE